ncbi:MAG: DUF6067 family protein [Verrucomicrobiae bacterium]|nr:DUF6067 family protein [Verrucomicrobiae bacterium]
MQQLCLLSFLSALLLTVSRLSLAAAESPCFYADFENGPDATKAAGNPRAACAQPAIFKDGLCGRAILVGYSPCEKKGHWLRYAAPANLNLTGGTISFWVKPDDWKTRDKAFRHFFEAIGPTARLLIYQYRTTKELTFLLGPAQTNEGKSQWTAVETPITDWDQTSWHQVVCTWDTKEIKLHLDGELRAAKPIRVAPSGEFSEFAIGGFRPEEWKGTSGLSLLDELKIFATALPSSEVHASYQKPGPLTRPKPFLALPMTALAPASGGPIKTGEYSFQGTGFFDLATQRYAPTQSAYYLGYDSTNLYLAITSPIAGALRCEATRPDDPNLWKDDVVELFVKSPKEPVEVFHIIANSRGTIFDAKNNDARWSMAGLRCQNHLEQNTWTARFTIPFSELGEPAPNPGDSWFLNICRSFAGLAQYTSMAPVKSSYHDDANFFTIQFAPTSPSIQLATIGNLACGLLAMDLHIANRTAKAEHIQLSATVRDATAPESNFVRMENLAAKKDASFTFTRSGLRGDGKFDLQVSGRTGLLYRNTLVFSTEPPIKFLYLYTLPQRNALRLGFQQLELTHAGKSILGEIKLLDENRQVALTHSFQPERSNYETEVEIGALKDGHYSIEIAFATADGAILLKESRTYLKGKWPPPWTGNQLGSADQVPDPWVPLKTANRTVTCLNRVYSFKGSILPSQISSQGEELLSSPIAVRATLGGKQHTSEAHRFKWIEKGNSLTKLETAGRLGPIPIKAEIAIEYDGFLWINLVLDPERPVLLENLALEIPFRPKAATLLNTGDYFLRNTGALPPNGWSQSLAAKPVFWLGNASYGLQWTAQNLAGWHFSQPDHNLEITSDKDAVVARLHLVDSPILLQKQRQIAFGLEATPARPPVLGWRKWRFGPMLTKQQRTNFCIWFLKWSRFYGYPSPAADASTRLAALKKQVAKVAPYLALHATSPHSPEAQYYGNEWRQTPQPRTPLTYALPGAKADPDLDETRVCLNSQSYRDFFLWKLAESLKSLPRLDGIYFDWAQLFSCNSLEHGCGWRDDEGNLQSSYDVLGARDFAKRVYVLLKNSNPDAVILHHESGEVNLAVHAFADVLVDGENLWDSIAKKDVPNYYQVLPVDKFQAQYSSAPWGPTVAFLPQFTRSAIMKGNDLAKTCTPQQLSAVVSHLLGLILVHDTQIWMTHLPPSTATLADRYFNILDEFGWDSGVEYLPYWRKVPDFTLLEPERPDVVLSGFKKNGKLLLVPFNNSDQDLEVKIRLQLPSSALPQISEKWTKATIACDGNRLTFSLPKRSFLAILIETQK